MALQDLTMMLPSRLGCPLSLKTPNMGNTGYIVPGKCTVVLIPPAQTFYERIMVSVPE